MEAMGWVIVVGAVFAGINGVVNLIIAYFDRKQKAKADKERIEREDAREERLRMETRHAAERVASKVETVASKVETEAAKVAEKVEAVKEDVKTEAAKVAETLIHANGTLKTELIQAVAEVVKSPDSKPKDG